MQIIIEHPELESQKTRLSANVAIAATSSTVENNTGFSTSDYTVFGLPGEELTEIALLTSTTGSTTIGHTAGLTFAHAARTQVAKIKYNQAQIYTASSEDGSYSLLTTVDLTLDNDVTVYDDTTGTSSTWYKIKYYNETTTAVSSFSVAVQGTGYTDDSLRSMTDEILEEFNDPQARDITRDQIKNYLRSGVRKLTTEIMKFYPDYLRTYTTQDLTSGTSTYSLPTGFLGFVRVDLNLAGTSATSAYKVNFISESFGEADTTYSGYDPLIAIRGSNYVVRPTPNATGKAFIWYWARPTVMSDDNDEHGLPYGARDVLVNYALYRVWLSKDRDMASSYKSMYTDSIDDYMDFLAQQRQTINTRNVDVLFGAEMYEE